MINYKKDDFDENLDDIMNSINGILSKNKVGYEVEENDDKDGDNVGILIKPNQRRLYNGVGGIIDYDDIEEETLEPGEIVILDTDMIERE